MQGTACLSQTIKNSTTMNTTKVYVINANMKGGNATTWDDERFIARAKARGNEYTLEAFQAAINNEELFLDNSWIRFITDQPQQATTFIKSVYTEQTGGGMMVDYVVLKDGKVITLNDEGLAVYPNIDATYDASESYGSIDYSGATTPSPSPVTLSLPQAIEDIQQAKNFLTYLHEKQMTWHPDDNVLDCFDSGTLSDDDGQLLNKLMQDVLALEGFDPYSFLLELDPEYVNMVKEDVAKIEEPPVTDVEQWLEDNRLSILQQLIPNEDLSLCMYNIECDERTDGGEKQASIEISLPTSVYNDIDWDIANEIVERICGGVLGEACLTSCDDDCTMLITLEEPNFRR